MSSPRSHKDDKPLARVKEALIAYGYTNLIELPQPGTEHETHFLGKVSLKKLGGTAIGIYKATYLSESKGEHPYIVRMLPNDIALDCYLALRKIDNPDLNRFLPLQYEFIRDAITERFINYSLEIIEYCENGSLDKYTAPLDEEDRIPHASQHALQLLQMMHHLINAGYVYTDVKSPNFLVRSNHSLLVTDLKSLIPLKNNFHTAHILSTPIYQSLAWSALLDQNVVPTKEQILAEICYKLGITLYQMVTGHDVTKEFTEKASKVFSKQNLALSQYQAAYSKINEINDLKDPLNKCGLAFLAFRKSVQENLSTAFKLENDYLLALCILRTFLSEGQEHLVQQLQDAASAHINAVRKDKKITLDSLLKKNLIPNTSPEEKILHDVIIRLTQPDENKRASIELALALLQSVQVEQKIIPKLKLPAFGSSANMFTPRSSPASSSHSPNSMAHSSSTPTTPNSSGSSKSATKSAQSAPTTPASHRIHPRSTERFYDSDQTSTSPTRARSSTFSSDTGASESPLSFSLELQPKSPSKKHGTKKPREGSKLRSATITPSSSAPTADINGRARSNTEAYFETETALSSPRKRRFNVTTSDAISSVKSTSDPSLSTGQIRLVIPKK
ncbi:MAG: protein kinase domain-containing protein [Gammaproteobacteria bacterium]